MIQTIIPFCCLVGFCIGSLSGLLQAQDLQWKQFGKFHDAHQYGNIVAISQTQVLVVGGYTGIQNGILVQPTRNCEVIDIQHQKITTALPTVVPHAEAAFVQNGDSNCVIISGVSANSRLTPICEYYDRTYKAWRIIGSLKIARRQPMATFINNDEILVVGGTTQSGEPIAQTEIFHIRTGKSRLVSPFPYPIAAGVCSVSVGFSHGDAVVIAGKSRHDNPQRAIYRFDEKKGRWELKTHYLDSVIAPQSVRLFDARLLICGGIQSHKAGSPVILSPTIGIETYNGFRSIARMNTARYAHGLAQWSNDSLIVLGGADKNRQILRSVEWSDMLTGKSFSAPNLHEARLYPQIITLPGFDTYGHQQAARIIVAGGISPSNELLTSVEILEQTHRVPVVVNNNAESIFSYIPVSFFSLANVLIITAISISSLTLALVYLVRTLRQQLLNEQEKSRIRYENEQMAYQMLALQLQTLHLQMNPHFIYNSLAAVESLVLQQRTGVASYYIQILAKLFRLVLEHSDNSTESIRQSLEFLNIYLALEQLRMDQTFDYNIHHTIIPEYQNFEIPSMIIQPYVENSIKYGVGLLDVFNEEYPEKRRRGNIVITVTLREQHSEMFLICVVEDNGVGRSMAETIHTHNTYRGLSRSTQITEQRLRILSALHFEPRNVEYEDLYDADRTPLGTRVTITIPILTWVAHSRGAS